MSKIETKTSELSLHDQMRGMNTSQKVRFLTPNFPRSEIAKILNIRYQHVRNVQITPVKKS
jgi:hypothetical protein